MIKVLVAYGSGRGGTGEIAERIGESLRELGLAVVVRPAREVTDVRSFDAVVLGGSLFMNRWHRDAHSFARRHQRILRQRPVWLFSSGPPSPSGLANTAQSLDVRGQADFGEAATPKSLLSGVLGAKPAATLDELNQAAAWAKEI
ncbi:flavodoxin domain-containing protein, partial [Actinocorallia lasiicapitis]